MSEFNGLGVGLHNVWRTSNAKSRSISAENYTGEKGKAGMAAEGIIRGNGGQNVQRACWNSLDTWMTSDIPSEARWRSINWGVLKLVRP